MKSGKTRNVSFDIMRIIATLMVIGLHYFSHGGALYLYEFGEIEAEIIWLIESFIFIAVDCFVLLTGYFAIDIQVKVSKIFKIWVQVLTYSVFSVVLLALVLPSKVGVKEILYAFTPLSSSISWFATRYVIFYAMLPILNILVNNISRGIHCKIIIILGGMISIWQTFFFWQEGNFNDLFLFILLYFIASYIRVYNIAIKISKCVIAFLTSAALLYLSRVCIGMVTLYMFGEAKTSLLYRYYSPLVISEAVSFLLIFKNIKVKNKYVIKLVSWMSPLVFGVYLLHDNNFMRQIIWQYINVEEFGFFGVTGIILGGIFVVLIVFLIGICFEFFRLKLYEKVFTTIEKELDIKINKIIKRINLLRKSE